MWIKTLGVYETLMTRNALCCMLFLAVNQLLTQALLSPRNQSGFVVVVVVVKKKKTLKHFLTT